MSEENVEIVRQGFDAFNAFMRGESAEKALAALVDPEFEYDWPAEREWPGPDHRQGVPLAFAFIRWVQGALIDVVWEPLELIEAPGNRVLAEVRQSGRDRESGVPIEVQLFHVVTLRDGRVRKLEFFRHRAEALEAAGLRE
ncbi:MAG: nuclear transport factor 2 family protein [Solirubrobacterales bacterium]